MGGETSPAQIGDNLRLVDRPDPVSLGGDRGLRAQICLCERSGHLTFGGRAESCRSPPRAVRPSPLIVLAWGQGGRKRRRELHHVRPLAFRPVAAVEPIREIEERIECLTSTVARLPLVIGAVNELDRRWFLI